MTYLAIIDPNTFIWNEEDFYLDQTSYFTLTEELMEFIELMESEKPIFLLRDELLDEMVNGFPACEVSSTFPELYDFNQAVYRFLANIQIKSFESVILSNINSNPQLNKTHYPKEVVDEIKYLLSEILLYDEMIIVFFTFNLFWPSLNSILEVYSKDLYKEFITPYDNYQRTVFFDSIKRKFESSGKHKPIYGWGSELPISDEICQTILESAVADGENTKKLYGYYDGRYIVFRQHDRNKYHGYPVSEGEVPSSIRKKITLS